jgi:ATPase subunit of ABC transporter with duplicated ATPase domains
MFTMLHLTKSLPDGSRTLLKDINLCFFPGAKIGVVGLNGSGKSSLLKIMAGVDTEFDGTARPMDGISIGYLAQEPELKGETVQECMRAAMTDGQALLDRFTELSAKLSEPLEPEEMAAPRFVPPAASCNTCNSSSAAVSSTSSASASVKPTTSCSLTPPARATSNSSAPAEVMRTRF